MANLLVEEVGVRTLCAGELPASARSTATSISLLLQLLLRLAKLFRTAESLNHSIVVNHAGE